MNGWIKFSVPIEPVPYARTGGHGSVRFTPPKQRHYMAQIRFFAAQAMGGRPPFEGPLRMTVVFTSTVPASWSKKKKAAARWKTSKPDLSNLIKAVEDALNGCVFVDDAQIVEISARKIYGDRPFLAIIIGALDTPAEP